MLTGIDHVIFAVADVDAAARQVEASLGLVVAGGGLHEAHGTYNRLFWLGDSYVELMGVFDAELATHSWWGAHILAVLEKGTDSPAGVVLATDDLEAEVSRLRAMGSTIGDAAAGERRRPDGEVVRWWTARPAAPDPDLGLIFAIEHDATGAEWTPDDRAARASTELPDLGRARLARVEFAVADVARASIRLLRELGVQFRPSLAGGGARDASVGAQTLRLLPARPGAHTTIALRASGLAAPRRASLLGCDWSIEPG
jgi:catechol 2,3-dioxygenase-like lactoylglutathione lyase family enzyme